MTEPEVYIERVESYSAEIASGIGLLLPDLSPQMDAQPIPEDVLRPIIESPDREQLIARMNGRIVGAATMNLIFGPAEGKKGWLEGFVVSSDETVRGKGVGYKLWQEMERWCQEKGVSLCFSSHPRREAAHDFYERQGAKASGSTLFYAFTDLVTR